MESIYKRTFSSGQKNQLTDFQRSVLANSNAISTASGDFARLTKEVKKFLGLAKQKPSTARDSKELKKVVKQRKNRSIRRL